MKRFSKLREIKEPTGQLKDACWTGYTAVGMKMKNGKKVPNCVPVKEAKEKTEYDYEGNMARGQLQSIINNAQRVHDMLKDNDNLPEWVQSKITLAEDYISTVSNYLMSEVDESVEEIDEEKHSVLFKTNKSEPKISVAHYDSKETAHKFLDSVKSKGGNGIVKTVKESASSRLMTMLKSKQLIKNPPKTPTPQERKPQGADFAAQRRKERLASNGRMDEEVEQIDELNQVTYVIIYTDTHGHKKKQTIKSSRGLEYVWKKFEQDNPRFRVSGFSSINDDEQGMAEEVEQIDELKTGTLIRYSTKANQSMIGGDRSKENKRIKGIHLATNKIKQRSQKPIKEVVEDEPHEIVHKETGKVISTHKNYKDASAAYEKLGSGSEGMTDHAIGHIPQKKMKEEVMQEGRPSQRHPLEGHEYHKKSDDELIHIAKDAHAAAEAMKSHNTTAENKYRDQANDSATVRHFRKTSGMPNWYKKKYGHVNEDSEIDVERTNTPAKRTVSRTTMMVKDVVKKAKEQKASKDKFESEPELSTQIIRNNF